ncbi:hypothetical protein JCM10207_000929 [Rhodosporidiobolus poonsookiae]
MSSAAHPFKVKPVPGKGEGLVATRKILAGEYVLQEAPAVVLQEAGGPASYQVYEIKSVFLTNAFPVGDKDLGALCLTGAKLNHSCRPNVERTWDEDANKMVFVALTDIEAGEEFTVAYVDVLYSSTNRQARVQSICGFTCVCEVCTFFSKNRAASNRRRIEARSLWDNVIPVEKRPAKIIKAVERVLELLAQEGPFVFHDELCNYAAVASLNNSDLAGATKWFTLRAEVVGLRCGRNSTVYHEALAYIEATLPSNRPSLW